MALVNIVSSNTIFLKIFKTLYQAFGPQHWWPGDSPFEIMIGAILTQNTSWHNVSKAINNIKEAGLLEPKALLKNKKMIARLIKPSGFYKIKSKRLVKFLEYYTRKYDAKKITEGLREDMLNIPGIGHETADSILLYALSRPVFVVDAYTRRIFSRHNIFAYNLAYDEIRRLFEDNLPKDIKIYNEYHALIVKTGKEYCKKNEPLCSNCPLHDIFPTP